MNVGQQRRARAVAKVRLLEVFAAAGLIVWKAIDGYHVGLAVAIGVMAAAIIGRGLSIAALAVAAGLGQWPAAAVAAIEVLAAALQRYLVPRGRPEPLDEQQLALLVASVPAEVIDAITVVTGGRADAVIDTPTLIQAAIRRDPSRWHDLTDAQIPRRQGSEGGPVAGAWTLCAAEAVLVGTQLATGPVAIHDLAVAAAAIPNSACGKDAAVVNAAMLATGYGHRHLSQALQRAGEHPGGRLIMTRVELNARHASINAAHELPEPRWAQLRGAAPAATPYAAPGTTTPRTAAEERTTSTARPRAARRPPERTATTTVASSTKSTGAPRSPGSTSPNARRQGSGLTRRARRRTSLWGKARAQWPAAALVAWWLVRPASTIAAVTIAVIGAVIDSWLPAVGCIALVVIVRPTRSVWLGLLATLAVWWLSVPVAVLIAARTVITAVTLLILGPGWRAGTQSLVRMRRSLIGTGELDQEWTTLRTAMQSADEIDYFDAIPRVLIAAWSTASFPTMLTTAVTVGKGVLLGRWPFPRMPRFGDAMITMVLVEEATEIAVRAMATMGAFLTAWLVVPHAGHAVFGFHVYAWIGAACAAGIAHRLTQRGPAAEIARGCVGWGLVTGVLSSRQAFLSIGIAGAIGLAGFAAQNYLERRRLAGRVRPARRLGGLQSFRVRDQWIAACGAERDGRLDVARQLWTQIASDSALVPAVRAGAWAALSDLAARVGDLQTAVTHANRAVELADTSTGCSSVYAIAGRISLAAGDTTGARALLTHPAISRRARKDPRYLAARAELLSIDSDAADAFAGLEASSVGLLRSGRLEDLVALEISVLQRLLVTADHDIVRKRLDSLIQFDFDDADIDQDTRERLAAGLARGRMLLGRLQLEQGEAQAAAATLRRAVADLAAPQHVIEHAIALILLGAATATLNPGEAIDHLRTGITDLEHARGALRAGAHRSQLIARHAAVYEYAFTALAGLQESYPAAGTLAATLCESLGRSALAHMLRRGELDISPAARRILASIAELERREDDGVLAELIAHHDQLRGLLSATFATAYLPEAVDYSSLRQRVGAAHILTFRVHHASPEQLRGHVIWTPPDNAIPHIAAIQLESPRLLDMLGTRGDQAREECMRRPSLGRDKQAWRELGDALLPEGLRRVIADADERRPAHLVLVPDNVLVVLPWAAIRLDDGRFLAQAATVQQIPTLDLLENPAAAKGRPPNPATEARVRVPTAVAVYLDDAIAPSHERESIALFHNVQRISTLDELHACLQTRQLAGAYIAAHGGGLGLQQHVTFTGSGRLSAASALSYPWPEWTIFASCLVGRLDYALGDDPLGIPVSCLIGGAQSVLGGVIRVNDILAGRLAASVAVRLDTRIHPAEALRHAQLAFLGTPRRSPEPRRWAGFVCVSRSVPAHCHETHSTHAA